MGCRDIYNSRQIYCKWVCSHTNVFPLPTKGERLLREGWAEAQPGIQLGTPGGARNDLPWSADRVRLSWSTSPGGEVGDDRPKGRPVEDFPVSRGWPQGQPRKLPPPAPAETAQAPSRMFSEERER